MRTAQPADTVDLPKTFQLPLAVAALRVRPHAHQTLEVRSRSPILRKLPLAARVMSANDDDSKMSNTIIDQLSFQLSHSHSL